MKENEKFVLLVIFFSIQFILEAPLSLQADDATSKATNPNYPQQSVQLNKILTECADAKEIQIRLQEKTDQGIIRLINQTNWSQIRTATTITILTNLSLLEDGILKTSVATNIEIKPPNEMSLPSGAPNDLIKNPVERENMEAYSAACKASTRIWNLHQALLAEHRRHWDRAINLVVDAYSHPPAADGEIKKFLTTYAGYDFSLQISNRLFTINPK